MRDSALALLACPGCNGDLVIAAARAIERDPDGHTRLQARGFPSASSVSTEIGRTHTASGAMASGETPRLA
jgi:uncharacterized protein YbaR (Trm112 family)